MFCGRSSPPGFSICLSQHWCEGKTNQNVKWLSDWKRQDEFIETSVFRRLLSKPPEECSHLNCPPCYLARSLVSSGPQYASPHLCLRGVVFGPVAYGWGNTNCLASDGSCRREQAYALKPGRNPNGQEATHRLGIGFLCSLKLSCLEEKLLSVEQGGVLLRLAFEYREFSFSASEACVGM